MKVTVDVNEKRIADLLSCAFDGGVGYWCVIVDTIRPDKIRSVWGEDTICPYIDYPLTGGAIICNLLEDDVPNNMILNIAAINKGLTLMAKNAPEHWGDFLAEREDSVTGDVFLQFCLLGEIVYG